MTKPKSLSPEHLATARASFIAFYAPQGWADLQDPDVDLFRVVDADLANLWDGWLARTCVILAQAVYCPGEVNDWFLSLEAGHQKVLIDDKWNLASAAYRAGMTKHLRTALIDFETAGAMSVIVEPAVEAFHNEALQMRVALLEELLTKSSEVLSSVGNHAADELNKQIQGALSGKLDHIPAIFLPPKRDCEDGYPSDDQLQAWEWNRCIDTIAGMNGHLESEVVTASNGAPPNWARLRHPAKVGSVIFAKGVSSRLVVGAAERAFAFSQKPGQEAARLKALGAFLNVVSQKQEALLSNELIPGFYWEYVREQGVADCETLPRLVEVTCENEITYIWVGEDRTAVLGYVFQNAFYIPAQRQMLDKVDFESAIARMPERKGFR